MVRRADQRPEPGEQLAAGAEMRVPQVLGRRGARHELALVPDELQRPRLGIEPDPSVWQFLRPKGVQ